MGTYPEEFKMLEEENERLKAKAERYERALKEIANFDYRGNRHSSFFIAERALKEGGKHE
tara:strand:+ start:1363 stop:1542 length:180 start_codon:yes stop_codon:yes gene_type:complete